MLVNIYMFFNISSHSQQNLDNQLTLEFRKMIQADYLARYDSLAPLFKAHLQKSLSTSAAFATPFDSLSNEMLIIQSEDKNLRIFSWDEISGGTWHDMAAFVQYKTKTGHIKVSQLDTDREGELSQYTDVIVNKIHQVVMNDQIHYLTIGWGTHGAGNHHMIARIFKIDGENLIRCASCFSTNEDLVIEAPRSIKIGLVFNSTNNEITYNEFKMNEDSGFNELTGKLVVLKLKNGKFGK
jgi:hypothetical protein